MRQIESLHVAISANANVLSDGQSLRIQGCGRVAFTSQREIYTGPLITFVICIRRLHADYAEAISSKESIRFVFFENRKLYLVFILYSQHRY